MASPSPLVAVADAKGGLLFSLLTAKIEGQHVTFTGMQDGSVKKFDTTGNTIESLGGGPLTTRKLHSNWVRALVFHPNHPDFIASASNDKTIKVINPTTEEVLRSIDTQQYEACTCAISPMECIVFGGYGKGDANQKVKVVGWDLTSGDEVCSMSDPHQPMKRITAMCFHTTNSALLFTSHDDGDSYVRVWNVKVQQCIHRITHTAKGHRLYGKPHHSMCAWVNPNSCWLAVPCRRKEGSRTNCGGVAVFSVSDDGLSALLEREFFDHADSVTSIAVSPFDPNVMATGSTNSTIKVYNVTKGAILASLEGSESYVYALAFSVTDSCALLSGGADGTDGTLRMWDLSAYAPVSLVPTLLAHTPPLPTHNQSLALRTSNFLTSNA